MEANKYSIKDFISFIRKEAADIPNNFTQATSNYCYVRCFSTYLIGGLVISLIE